MRKYLFHIVEPSNKKDASHYFDLTIMVLILLSVLDIILKSEESLKIKYALYFTFFETLSGHRVPKVYFVENGFDRFAINPTFLPAVHWSRLAIFKSSETVQGVSNT